MAISDEITRLQNAKSQIKTAIENKGVTVPEGTTLDGYSPLIDEIKTQGEYQSKSVVPSKSEQSIKPDEGYDALSSVLVAETPLEEKTVAPTTGGLIVEPEGNNIGLSKVTVTGDHNLTSSNIKNGVTIFGVTGTFEGSGGGGGDDFSDIGNTVSVEAKTSFYAGERFVGVKNDSYLTPTMSSLALGITSIIDASEDLSVAVPSQTITASSTTIKIGFLNDQNAYELVDVALPSAVSSITSNLTLAASNCTVNEDGSLIAIGGLIINDGSKTTSNVIVIETSIGSKTATASWQGALDYGYSGVEVWANASPTAMIFTKNYLLYSGSARYTYTKADGTQTSGDSGGGVIFYYNGNNFSQAIYKPSNYNTSYNSNDVWDKNCVAWADEDTLITISLYIRNFNYQLRKFVLNGSTVVSMANKGMGVWSTGSYGATQYAISGNARYIARADRRDDKERTTETVWSFNYLDLSTTQIGYRYNNYSESGYAYPYKLIPESTGEFVYNTSKKQIRRITALGTGVYGGGNEMSSKHFDIMNGMFYRDGVNKRFLSPRSQEAEYLISSTGAAITTEDRIYGIVPKNMVMGEIGTARGLFRT